MNEYETGQPMPIGDVRYTKEGVKWRQALADMADQAAFLDDEPSQEPLSAQGSVAQQEAELLAADRAQAKHWAMLERFFASGGQIELADEAEFNAMWGNLRKEQQDQLRAKRREMIKDTVERQRLQAGIEAKLRETAPALLEGRLPADQEVLLGGADYAIGVNQSGPLTAQEAVEYLKEQRGIDLRHSPIAHRFLTMDHTMGPPDIRHTVVDGYYGPQASGKFVVAMPLGPDAHEIERKGPAGAVRTMEYEPPADFYLEADVPGSARRVSRSVNAKYMAGFVDITGKYFPNRGFMEDRPR